jgi:hypothetical protein
MTKMGRLGVSFAVLLVLGPPESSTAQQQMNMPETKSAAPYHPGLGELMTAFVQPRHMLGELSETFDDVAELVPKHDGLPIPEMIASSVKQPMAVLDAAIKARDAAAFSKAYASLTGSCNACHQSARHPMIVIQVPTVSAFPDQDFRPPQK